MSPPKETNSHLFTLDIGGMTCASCVGRVEKALNQTPGVEAASVNLATEQAKIRLQTGAETTINSVIASVQKTGYDAKISTPNGKSEIKPQQALWGSDGLGRVLLSFTLSAPLFLPMLLMPFGIHWSLSPKWQLLLASPVQFFFGWRFYKAGFKSVLAGAGNMDLLVALGTSAAYGLSVYLMVASPHANHELYFEGSSVIICMVLLGKWLEARAKQQTSEAIRALQKLWPEQAKVLLPEAVIEGNAFLDQYRELALDQVFAKDRILVLPGERIPVDGVILFGSSHIDESLLTGESEPVKKTLEDKVIGGSLNGEGVIVVDAQAVGIESVLSKIITLVEDAQTQKAPIQKLVDQVSAIFVPSVLIIALLTGLVNWFYLDSAAIAILRAVSVLVIACPCALGLATPAAIMAGTGVAARFGILIKDPQVLEQAHRLNIVAFDKTGTLTIGKPRLLSLIPLSEKFNRSDILATAAGLQLGSEHPLAKALLDAAKEAGISPFPPTESKAIPGVGITGKTNSGPWSKQNLSLQSVASLHAGLETGNIAQKAQACLEAGQTVSVLMSKDIPETPIAIIAFGDELKSNAQQAIKALHQLRIRTVMLSGDNSAAANRVGNSIGIDEVFGQIMPSNKAEIIRKLQSADADHSRQWVAMVGDGVNDAPALAAADVGMAMSTGTDVAMQAAGITLMRGDPSLVADAIDISKRTWQKIQQNLFWAFIFNATGIPLAALGYLSPMLAGSAMALSSFCVLSNALLLKRWRPGQV
ncbi:heavy metal translocating P-type ATPase [Polynucleobacter asymbioticus]|uniref:P-type Cu(2+) transporter n=1 Tax=Polynucleobacter asymbioticus (strain DSM 18221 / CIP 109841 / QLW-P1DMWA-1) TaxID=312153 RepID=A4SYQ7_POLAQ|nr:heavy metal translocating P-type ATPase [Polynucleobacter asymbioticus]ABP34621.1 heavy metal translocating P-type ATPase [Polynucleobacter asymbioticus QLW-P1DMWA-1]APC06462.1 copper-transporting ATPase [Polynucleobacter asymbioticus]